MFLKRKKEHQQKQIMSTNQLTLTLVMNLQRCLLAEIMYTYGGSDGTAIKDGN